MNNQNSINPKFKLKQKRSLSKQDYLKGIKSRDINILGQSLSLAESKRLEDKSLVLDILKDHNPLVSSKRIAITGPPGVGKSTFLNCFINHLTSKGDSVAVLAVDPSSILSGGAILGDKTRMDDAAQLQNVFIRPLSAGDTLGGVQHSTYQSIALCEMAGFDWIFIETVGVGQSEHVVRSLVDCFILLLQPGSGDDLQGIKRGIVELADLFIVTKADGALTSLANDSLQYIKESISFLGQQDHQWKPKISLFSSYDNMGNEVLLTNIEEYFKHIINQDFFKKNRKQQLVLRFNEWMNQYLNDQIRQNPRFVKLQERAKEQISSDEQPQISTYFNEAKSYIDDLFNWIDQSNPK